MRKSGRGKNDVVNNFSSEVDDILDDFEIDDTDTSKPLSPKEYSSYRGKPKPRKDSVENSEQELDLEKPQVENNNKRPQGKGRPPGKNKGGRPSSSKQQRPGVTKTGNGNNKSNKNSKGGIIFIIGGLIIIILAGFFLFKGNDKEGTDDATGNTNEQQLADGDEYESMGEANKDVNASKPETEKPETPAPPEIPEVSMEDTDAINPGLPNTNSGNNKVNGGELSDPKDFHVDINGNPIPDNYEVKQIKYETDFVNYEKRRGVTGDGMELLWLDAEYKGIPYSVQVPFKIWKELDPKGITVVSMEVLYLDGDAKVISHMAVKENYKELLEKR